MLPLPGSWLPGNLSRSLYSIMPTCRGDVVVTGQVAGLHGESEYVSTCGVGVPAVLFLAMCALHWVSMCAMHQ